MKRIFIIFIILSSLANIKVLAETNDKTYIVKFHNDKSIHIFSAKEMDILQTKSYNCLKNNIGFYHDTIDYIEPNYDVELFNKSENKNWNISAINAPYAWRYTCYGNDIKIAMIDSGIYAHPYLKNCLLKGYNFINNSINTNDTIGHGTFVASIISAESNPNYVTGVSPKAKIIPLKCFDNNYSTKVATIAEAIYAAVDKYKCDIINMSFGLSNDSLTLKNAIEYALSENVILIAAVGNRGTSKLQYPAAYEGVIGVGSINAAYEHSEFSQFNDSVDIVAPGEDLCGILVNGFELNSGTSFSAPHVSAAAAIALCIDDTITPLQFNKLLQSTSHDLGESGYDEYYGYGLLDIEKMSKSLIQNYDFFMSPVNINNGKIQVTIANNTDENVSAIMVNAEYVHNTLANSLVNSIILPANSMQVIESGEFDNNSKCFLWGSFDTMKPLFRYRIYNQYS